MERFDEFAEFMSQVGDLKKLKRTGWINRGIENPESVADHSFRVAVMAMVLVDKSIVDRVIRMALIHDLAESIVGDIPPGGKITPEEKSDLERDALRKMCEGIRNGDEIIELFDEYEEGKSPSAKRTKELDKLEMMFQADEYGVEQPKVDLRAFWTHILTFDFGDLKEVYDNLESRHANRDEYQANELFHA